MKKIMIKIITAAAIMALAVTFVACGKNGEAQDISASETSTAEITEIESIPLESETVEAVTEEKDEIDVYIDGFGSNTQMYSELDNSVKAQIIARVKESGGNVEFTATGRTIVEFSDGRILVQKEDSSWTEYSGVVTLTETVTDSE